MDVIKLLQQAVLARASDVHLRVGTPPTLRVDGELRRTDLAPLTEEDLTRCVAVMFPASRARELERQNEADFAFEAPGVGRFRVNAFRQQGSTAVVLRRILSTVPTIEELGLPPVVRRIAEERRGLVLVTGRVGSGKTTTLASMIDHVNATRDGHILTVEDPIEIKHAQQRCLITQREIGTDTDDFHTALKFMLRQDPDVVLIGEMRDPETVQAAISAAETGHLVLSSLHTANVTETVNRILDFFPPAQHGNLRASLAASLRGIVSQRLLPRADGTGRLPAVEALVGTGRVFERIVAPDKTHELEEIMATGAYYGMQTFDQSLLGLYERDLITRRVAIGAASQPHDLRLAVDQLDASGARPPVASAAKAGA